MASDSKKMMEEAFDAEGVCPESRIYLLHSTVTSVRCGRCGLLNPNHSTPPPPLPVREPARPRPSLEAINVEYSPLKTTPSSIPPAKRRAVAAQEATIIPTVPGFKVGYAKKERQHANQRILDRKEKTGYASPTSIVHFSVGVAHFVWGHEDADDQGNWSTAMNQWSVDEENREVTSEGLLYSILLHIRNQTKREDLKKWLVPDGTVDGVWSLGHTNPKKLSPRDIVPWDAMKLLSDAIKSGSYDQRAVTGTSRRLVTIWLYWIPEEPLSPPPPSALSTLPHKRKSTKKAMPGTKRRGPTSIGSMSDHPVSHLQNSRAKKDDVNVDKGSDKEGGNTSVPFDLPGPSLEDLLNRA